MNERGERTRRGSGVSDPGGVSSELTGGIFRITIDRRDQANALSPDSIAGLRRAFAAAADDATVRVVTLAGAGGRAFCGGFDLAGVTSGVRDDHLVAMMRELRDSPIPTIAVVNGHAVGAGLDLACSCDLRIVRVGAKIGLPAVRLGVGYDAEGIWNMLRIAPGLRRALLTGELVEATGVVGFADVVCALDEIDEQVERLASGVARGAPRALEYMTRVIRAAGRLDSTGTEQLEGFRLEVLDGPDVSEAIAASQEGREPNFAPRRRPSDA